MQQSPDLCHFHKDELHVCSGRVLELYSCSTFTMPILNSHYSQNLKLICDLIDYWGYVCFVCPPLRCLLSFE